MKEETTNNTNDNTFSKEEVAIINAVFRLYELVILHRTYQRRSGKHLFTKGALASAESVLTALRPSAPGTNPVKIVAVMAKAQNLAKAAILYAADGMQKAEQETWERIRNIELSEADMKNLSFEAPIFRMYRDAATLDRAIKELSHDYMAGRIAHMAVSLANKFTEVWEERSSLPVREAA